MAKLKETNDSEKRSFEQNKLAILLSFLYPIIFFDAKELFKYRQYNEVCKQKSERKIKKEQTTCSEEKKSVGKMVRKQKAIRYLLFARSAHSERQGNQRK